MSGELIPRPDPTKLTTDALNREVQHIHNLNELRFTQLDLRLQQRFDAQQKAIDAALVAADTKTTVLENKVDRLSIDQKDAIPRQEYQALHSALNDKVDDLRNRYFAMEGKELAEPTVAEQIKAISDEMTTLRTYKDSTQGGLDKLAIIRPWMIWVAGAALSVVVFMANYVTSH